MQLEALKVFCEVVRCRSFSQAGTACALTQSAVSQVVRTLEKTMGVQLIDRTTRPLQLTDLGQLYYEGCKNLLEQYDELEAIIRQRQTESHTVIQVAAIYSVGLGNMGQLAERFEAQHPGTRIHIDYLHPDRVYEHVLDRTADLGLVSFPRRLREIQVLPWREEPMGLACAPNHVLARSRTIKPLQLAGEKYIGFDKDLVIRRHVDRFLREHGAAVDVVMEFDNIENIKKAVEIKAGVALLPEPTLRHEVQNGTLVALPLAGRPFVRPLGIIYSRHHRLNKTILELIDLLCDRQVGQSSSHAKANGQANGVPQAAQSRQASRRSRASRVS